MFFASLGLDDLQRRAATEGEVFLPHLAPGWQGAALAVAGAALGEGWAVLTRAGSASTSASPLIGWLALLLIFGGLLLQFTQWRVRGGWRVRLTDRTFTPEGRPGHPVTLGDEPGWSLACVAGERFRSVAIDLKHTERGRVARVYQTPGRARLKDIRACSALTDELARRLGIAREGLVA